MMIIDNLYNIGDTVYLKTDTDQLPRIVCSLSVFGSGEILYKLCQGTAVSEHYDFELSKEKNYITT